MIKLSKDTKSPPAIEELRYTASKYSSSSHPSVLTDHGTYEIYHVCMPGECRYGEAVVPHASRSALYIPMCFTLGNGSGPKLMAMSMVVISRGYSGLRPCWKNSYNS